MNRTVKPQPYQAYILRFWKENEDLEKWRFSLEDVSGERSRRGFKNFEEMMNFLRSQVDDEESEKNPIS
ncbi:MAG: hypothetical protein U9O54_07065 [Chloroflexota bacterium]|nr:hypothetical protein [Chloroflexota bacterium]